MNHLDCQHEQERDQEETKQAPPRIKYVKKQTIKNDWRERSWLCRCAGRGKVEN